MKFELCEIALLDDQPRVITPLDQPHLQFTVAKHVLVELGNLFKQHALGFVDAHARDE